ncbi:MAG: 3'-5' exonuclease [Nitrospiraceae bacterium]|nr:MAG: 3'-5' exonuclease [Nitrospiraceae bacterium]
MRTTFFSKKTESASLLLGDAVYTVLDTELTGLDMKKDSIVSIGAVRMKGTRIDIGNSFYRLIHPAGRMDHKNILIHGITPSEVEEEPVVDAVLDDLSAFCGNSVIVGHFVSLDINFINRELKRTGRAKLKNAAVDTCKIYEWIKSSEGAFSRHYSARQDELDLFSLAREYNITFNEGHNALGDAFITAQLFQRFLYALPGLGVNSIRDLLKTGKA